MDKVEHLICVLGSPISSETKGPYFENQDYSARISTFDCVSEFPGYEAVSKK